MQPFLDTERYRSAKLGILAIIDRNFSKMFQCCCFELSDNKTSGICETFIKTNCHGGRLSTSTGGVKLMNIG